MTVSTYKDVTDRIAGLKEDQQAAELAGDSDLASMYSDRIKELETVATKIKSIGDAQKFVNGQHSMNNEELRNQLTIQEKLIDAGRKDMEQDNVYAFDVGFDFDGDGKIDDRLKRFKFGGMGMFDDEETARNKAYQKYLQEREDITIDFLDEDTQFMIDYYTNLLKVDENANAELVDNQRQMYDTLAQDQEEFANAREELFFGERSNFTGAIYKQITQGGVESVLHRVEFIQTNNFNGMVLEEMVEQVSQGVVDELRSLGVPL